MTRSALLIALLMPAAALAQVSVNPGALDQLKSSPSSAPAAAPARADRAHAPARRATPARPRTSHPAQPASAPTPVARPRPVTVAPAPPPPAVLPPVVEVPHAAPPPPPPVPVVPDAAGEAVAVPGGIRVTFGAGKSDLNPATDAALQKLASEVKGDPSIDLNVVAYAAGDANDPSTPRRLSLSRALVARAVLISEGIVSTRIYVRALGATPSDGPPERVDVVRSGTAAPPAPPPATAAPASVAPGPAPAATR